MTYLVKVCSNCKPNCVHFKSIVIWSILLHAIFLRKIQNDKSNRNNKMIHIIIHNRLKSYLEDNWHLLFVLILPKLFEFVHMKTEKRCRMTNSFPQRNTIATAILYTVKSRVLTCVTNWKINFLSKRSQYINVANACCYAVPHCYFRIV